MAEFKESGKPFKPAPGEARAKLFQHGGSQAVRLPKEFRFEGGEVRVRKEGDAVILEPLKPRHPQTREEWDAFWAKLDALGDGEVLVRPPQPPLGEPPVFDD